MQGDIQRVLISRDEIAQRVKQIAADITRDLTDQNVQTDQEITLLPILTGSIIFVADLIRLLPIRMRIGLVSISSYRGATTTGNQTLIREELTNLPDSLENACVLIVDDILDSGNTLRLVTDILRRRNPAIIRTCVLLRKQRPEAMDFPVDYVCFDIPDEFVVGYGLDYNDYYRNLPNIVTLRPQIVDGAPTDDCQGAAQDQ